MGMGGKGGGGKGGGGMGGISPFDEGALQQALGQNIQQISNRYAQLGIGTPGAGQSAASAAAGHTNLTAGGPSTMELQDIGPGASDPTWGVAGIPSASGGATGQEQALEGAIQTANTGSQALGGIGTSPLTPGLQQLAQQSGNADTGGFGAGFNSGTGV